MIAKCACCEETVPQSEIRCLSCMDKKPSMLQKAMGISEYLIAFHTGKENAIPSCELESVFSIGGRSLRRIINFLRQEGVPICSDATGYYYADSRHEINQTVKRLGGLIDNISVAREGLTMSDVDMKV